MEKTCTVCGETKLLGEYHKKKGGKYGRASMCKVCRKAYMKAYEQTEARKAKKKKYMKVYMKTYSQTEARKAYHKAYMKNRYKTDPVFKLHNILSSGFRKWIKGNTKTCKTEQYVCCSYQELLEHLESQFDEGMSWENQGEWHIDHFKAQSRFDPTIEEEKYKCWHYTNLQPMWAEMNIGWKDKKKPGDENRIWKGREIGWVS